MILRILYITMVLFLFSSCKFWDSISGVIKYPVKNIAIVDIPKTLSTHTSFTYYKYFVNGEEYSGSTGYYYDCEELGSAYEIVYDSIYPNFSQINLCKPLFIKEDVVDTTIGHIVSDDVDNRTKLIEYYYNLNNEKIRKMQFICPDTLAKYKDIIKVSNTFLVKYNVNYPKVAILYFDKLIKVAETPPTTH